MLINAAKHTNAIECSFQLNDLSTCISLKRSIPMITEQCQHIMIAIKLKSKHLTIRTVLIIMVPVYTLIQLWFLTSLFGFHCVNILACFKAKSSRSKHINSQLLGVLTFSKLSVLLKFQRWPILVKI